MPAELPEIPAILIPSEGIREIRPIRGSSFGIQEEENRNHENTQIHENQRDGASRGEAPRSPPSLSISCFFVVPLSESGEQKANPLFLKFLPSGFKTGIREIRPIATQPLQMEKGKDGIARLQAGAKPHGKI